MSAYLLSHLVHEIRSSHALWEAWKVLDLCGGHKLPSPDAACLISLKHQRPYIGSSCIYCSCIPACEQHNITVRLSGIHIVSLLWTQK